MHTVETFYKPGLEPADDVLLAMMHTPRTVRPAGLRLSVLWRILACLVSFVACAYFVAFCYHNFVETADLLSWIAIIASVPICFVYIPWLLITSYASQIRSFKYCQNIYQNGSIALGSLNTLTRLSGQELICHHTERSWSFSPAKIRLDYTFNVGNTVRTGSAILSEQTINYLSMNSDICVLYLPDNPSENMIFPIPGYEFFEYHKK